MSRIMLYATLLAVLLAGCAKPSGDVTLTDLDHGPQSGIKEPGLRLITNQSLFDEWWSDNGASGDPHGDLKGVPAKPVVDFTTSEVLAANEGSHGSLCWDIRVSNATVLSNGTLAFTLTHYGPSGACMQAFGSAYDAVEVSGRWPIGNVTQAYGNWPAPT